MSTLPGGGRFDAQPDHLIVTSSTSGVLILTEDGGTTLVCLPTTGPNIYRTLNQRSLILPAGSMFQISRDDGLRFEGRRVLKH